MLFESDLIFISADFLSLTKAVDYGLSLMSYLTFLTYEELMTPEKNYSSSNQSSCNRGAEMGQPFEELFKSWSAFLTV